MRALMAARSARCSHMHEPMYYSDTLWVAGAPTGDGPSSIVCKQFSLFLPSFLFVLFSSGGDESQVALAIVLAASQDCAVYSCTINNEYGTDTTDFLLSIDSKIENGLDKLNILKTISYSRKLGSNTLLSVLQFYLKFY